MTPYGQSTLFELDIDPAVRKTSRRQSINRPSIKKLDTAAPNRIPATLAWLAGTNRLKLAPHRCPTCSTWTLAGLTREPGAIFATVTWTPLDTHGETAVATAGICTYTLFRTNQGAELSTRNTPRSVRNHPPLGPAPPWRLYDVIPAHRCGHSLEHHRVPTRLTPPPERTASNECSY